MIKKTMRKGTFLQEGQCAALTSFRVGKMSFLWQKGMFFTILLKRCEKGGPRRPWPICFGPK